jgi:hypothetical protein
MKDIETSRPVSIVRPVAMISCVAVMIIAFFISPSPSSKLLRELRPEEIPYILAMLLAMLVLSILMLRDLKARLGSLLDRLNVLAAKDA